MADIYQREDTMEIYDIEKLQELYRRNSKHSGYQMLSSELEKLLHSDELNIVSRYERQRLEYIQQYMDLKNKNILDIGGNTGYFSFEVLKDGAKHVDYYEGNPQHAEFVKIAAKLLHYDKKMNIFPEYFQFDKNEDKYDVILNLNVIHHLGDDFKKGLKKDAAKKKMLEYMNGLSYDSPVMVFQMGFNWNGNCSEGLFPDGTKKEMEQFIVEGTKEYWKVMAIGIAEKKGKEITYQDLNEKNNTRQDDLGEFLNRPLFIMKSLKFV